MPKGVKIPDEKKMEVLWDAARDGVKKAAEMHDVPEGTIYGWTHQKAELFSALKARLRPVIEMDAYEMASMAMKRLKSKLADEKTDIAVGHLIGMIREAWSIFERMGRMDATENALKELMDKIEAGHEKSIELLNAAIPHLSTKACQHILSESESYDDDSERNTDGEDVT